MPISEKRKRRFIYGLYGFYGKDDCVLFPRRAYRIRVSTLPKQRSEEQERGGTVMTDYEYELMQEALRKHLKTSHGYHGVKKDVFNEGIKVAMSMLKQFHEFPRVKDGE